MPTGYEYYVFDTHTFSQLRDVMDRLFAPQILSPDQRRDLANAMYVLMARAVPITEEDFNSQPKRSA